MRLNKGTTIKNNLSLIGPELLLIKEAEHGSCISQYYRIIMLDE